MRLNSIKFIILCTFRYCISSWVQYKTWPRLQGSTPVSSFASDSEVLEEGTNRRPLVLSISPRSSMSEKEGEDSSQPATPKRMFHGKFNIGASFCSCLPDARSKNFQDSCALDPLKFCSSFYLYLCLSLGRYLVSCFIFSLWFFHRICRFYCLMLLFALLIFACINSARISSSF